MPPLTEAALRRALEPAALVGRELRCLPEVTSTNDLLKALARQGAPEGLVLLAERQTAGRGRLGRNFQSPAGKGLWLSLLLRPQCPPERLPQVTAQQLAAMDLDKDLAAAKEASYTLYAAKKTLDDAEETYKDAAREYNYNQEKYQYVQAQHAWQGAQYTYEGAVQSFELSFRTLYAQVQDYRQVLQAAQTALAVEQDNYAVDQLKYEQGTISQNDLLTAQDDLATAQDTVNTARRNLFSAYNSYCWAVERGILN